MIKIIKKILWSILAFIIIFSFHPLAMIILHPVGGHEFHELFSYYSGGHLDVAQMVFIKYMSVASILAFGLIFFRYPAHWLIVASIATFIAWMNWSNICYFPYQSAEFHQSCTSRLPFIPTIVFSTGFLAKFLSLKYFHWIKERGHRLNTIE